jgi:hypothetical protein
MTSEQVRTEPTMTVSTAGSTTNLQYSTVSYNGTSMYTTAPLDLSQIARSMLPETREVREAIPPKASRRNYVRYLKKKGYDVLGWVECEQCKDSIYIAVEKDQRYRTWHIDFQDVGRHFIPDISEYDGHVEYKTSGELLQRLDTWTDASEGPTALMLKIRSKLT